MSPRLTEIRLCIDVPDMDAALRFYTRGLGLEIGRRFDKDWAELLGAPISIDLLVKAERSSPFGGAKRVRDYGRHWTPLHLDIVVTDIEAAMRRAEQFGAKREALREQVYGKLALMSDPFGNGFCFLEFQGKGYGEINRTSTEPGHSEHPT